MEDTINKEVIDAMKEALAKHEEELNRELTAEQQKEFESLKTQHSKVYVIRGINDDGNELVGFFKKPSYELKKKVTIMQAKDKNSVFEVGEMILVDCFIGGDDLFENEDVRFQAVLAANELIPSKTSFNLLKKS